MMYQVIVPGRGPIGTECLEAIGLSSMVDVPGERWNDVLKGPNGLGVCRMVTWTNEASEVPVHCPEDWEYTDYGKFLVGSDPVYPPVHEDMILPDFTPGNPVEFESNTVLVMPVAEKLEATHRLVDGEWVRKVSSRYEAFYLKAEEIWEQVALGLDAANLFDMPEDQRPRTAPITLDIANDFVCDAVRINYKLFPEAIDHLKLLGDITVARVVIAVLDIEDIARVYDDKKKEGSVDIPVT